MLLNYYVAFGTSGLVCCWSCRIGSISFVHCYACQRYGATNYINSGTICSTICSYNTAKDMTAALPEIGSLEGKHALFFKFASPEKEKSVCRLESFVFE